MRSPAISYGRSKVYLHVKSTWDHPVGDPTGGPAYGLREMPHVAAAFSAVFTTGVAATITQVLVVVSTISSVVGMVTGNETLMKIGSITGLAAGVASFTEIGGQTLGQVFGGAEAGAGPQLAGAEGMGNVVSTADLTADAARQANISVGGDAAMTGGAPSVTTGATQTGANNVAQATGQVDPGKALTQGASPAGTAFNQDVMARANSWGPASNTTNPTGLIGSNTGTLAAEAGLNNLTTGNLAQNALGGAGVTDWSSAINAGIGAPKAGGGFMDWLAGTDSATKAMLMQGVGGAASALSGYMSKEKELETLERLKKDEQKRTSVKVGGIRISDNALRKNTQLGAY